MRGTRPGPQGQVAVVHPRGCRAGAGAPMTGARVLSQYGKSPVLKASRWPTSKQTWRLGGAHPAQDFQKKFRLGLVDVFQHHRDAVRRRQGGQLLPGGGAAGQPAFLVPAVVPGFIAQVADQRPRAGIPADSGRPGAAAGGTRPGRRRPGPPGPGPERGRAG